MQTYANKFSIAISHEQNEAILNFYQQVPKQDITNFGKENVQIEVETIPVASLVLHKEVAEQVLASLSDVLKPDKK